MPQYVLAIDLGTSGPKIALLDEQGRLCATAFEPVSLKLLPGGGAEQSPDDWWRAICDGTRQMLAGMSVRPDEIVAVGATAHWSGTVAVDADGRPLMDAILWMDTRGAPHVRRATGGRLEVQGYGLDKLLPWLHLSGGLPTHAGKDSIGHILYLKHERPAIYAAAHKFLEPKDYLNLRLTGRMASTYDSIALHWVTDNRDPRRVVYSDRLLRLVGVERAKLPDLISAVDVLGGLRPEAAETLGLRPGTPVIGGTGDLHSAAIGVGAVGPGQANLYIGTSDWLICHVPAKKTDLAHNMASLPSPLPGRYLLLNEQECAGVCLTFLRDNVFYPEDGLSSGPRPANAYALFDQTAARVPAGSGGVLFLPWLYGERTPIEDHHVRGAYFNLSLETTRAQLIRAALEGVAFNLRWLLRHVEAFAGHRLETINFNGGGAQSDLWCQILADVLDRTIQPVDTPLHSNALGIGLLTLVGLGQLEVDAIPQRVRFRARFAPNPAHRRIYDELFHEFTGLYDRNRAAFARLNRRR